MFMSYTNANSSTEDNNSNINNSSNHIIASSSVGHNSHTNFHSGSENLYTSNPTENNSVNDSGSSYSSVGYGGVGDIVTQSMMFNETDDASQINGNVAALSRLAELALTSMDKLTREQAAQQLLFLGSYDHWHTTKQLFMQCSNQYLYFMVAKAVLFIVRNELGPQERAEMALCALERLQRHREAGEVLPRFLKGVLYSIFVSGVYSNWKIALFTMLQSDSNNPDDDDDDDENDNHNNNDNNRAEGQENGTASSSTASTQAYGPSHNNHVSSPGKGSHRSDATGNFAADLNPNNIGPSLVSQFESYLAPDEALDCLLEAITYFAAQSAKLQIMDLEASYAKHALPYFFLIAANSLSSHTTRAAEVCCAALDCVPRVDVPLVHVGVTTDASIHIANWPVWNASFLTVMRFCRAAIADDPGGGDAALFARLLRSCSCVVCPEASFLRARNDFARELLLIADSLLALCEQDNTLTELLLVACVISVNTLERYEDVAVEYFMSHVNSAQEGGGGRGNGGGSAAAARLDRDAGHCARGAEVNSSHVGNREEDESARYCHPASGTRTMCEGGDSRSGAGYEADMHGSTAGGANGYARETAQASLAQDGNHSSLYPNHNNNNNGNNTMNSDAWGSHAAQDSCAGGIIQRWAQAALFVITRFDDSEDELRRWLMQLFYLFGDRLLPAKSYSLSGPSALTRSASASTMMMSMPLSEYPASALMSSGEGASAAVRPPPKSSASFNSESDAGRMGRARGYSFPPAMTASNRLNITTTLTYPHSSCNNHNSNNQHATMHRNGGSWNEDGGLSNSAEAAAAAAHASSACNDEPSAVEWAVRAVCMRYFETVVAKAPLREGSHELRSANGVILHNERTLMPLSQLLFCERVTLKPALIATLQRTIEQYRMCLRERAQLRSCHAGGVVAKEPMGFVERVMRYLSHTETMTTSRGGGSAATAGEADVLALAAEYAPLMSRLDDESALLFLTNACLSRLSVMISVFAIAMVNEIVVRDDTVLELIAGFARELLTEDDSLTDELLRCLTLTDSSSGSPMFSFTNPHNNNNNNNNTNTNTNRYNNNSNYGTHSGSFSAGWSDEQGKHAPAERDGVGATTTHTAKVHVAVLRSLFFFCGCVYESEFLRRTAFYEIVLNLLKFVYLHHSDEPALLMDANMLLYRTVTNGVSATVFLNSPKLYAIITAVSADRISALRFPLSTSAATTTTSATTRTTTMMMSSSRAGEDDFRLTSDENDARSDFLTSFCVFVETRFYAGYDVDHVLSTLVRRTLSPARLQSRYAKRALEDVVAITRACCQPDSLETVLAATFDAAEAVLQCMHANSACVPVTVRWAAQLCGLAQEALDRSTTAQTPWRLGRFIFGVMHACFRDLTLRSGYSEESMTHASANSNTHTNTPTRMHYRFASDVAEPAMIYDLADVVQSLCHGSWFNVGVALYYERETVEDFFCGAVQLLLSTSVQMVMSNERGCHKMFVALLSVLMMESDVTRQVSMLFIRRGLWQRLLGYLSKCLGYAYHPILLQVMLIIVNANAEYAHMRMVQQQQQQSAQPQSPSPSASSSSGEERADSIDEATLGAVFYEAAVLLVVAPHLEIRDMHFCFELLKRCYESAPMSCTNYMDRLLTYCSAYHRVRLRMVLTMLRERRDEIMQHYLQVFGQTSKAPAMAVDRRTRRGAIHFKTFLRNTILDVMRSRGWIETNSDTGWDYYWADVSWIRENYDHVRLDDNQRINHFRNHYELTRKDIMVRNFKRMRKALEKEGNVEEAAAWDFFPVTFSLPQDYGMFEKEFRRQPPNTIWIMKPPAKAQGKGIFLFSKLSQISEWRKEFRQRQGNSYLANSSNTNTSSNTNNSTNTAPTTASTTTTTTNNNNNTSAVSVLTNTLAANSAISSSATNGGNKAGSAPTHHSAANYSSAVATSSSSSSPQITSNASTMAAAYGVEAVELYLAQRYIANPHLVCGKKYDLRIYVLVQSFNPLVVWLHRTGFARFCHHRYALDDIDNTFIHVTNVAVQKTNPRYGSSAGCKFGIRSLRMHITATHGVERANEVFTAIQQMILRTLFAVQRIIIQDRHCTELYGYDVMLDDALHPWLIETNASPSLTAETPADYHLKFNMLEDMFNVIDLEKRRSGEEVRVGGFDLIWNGGPVGVSTCESGTSSSTSYLGCNNEYGIPLEQMRLPPRLQDTPSRERLLT